MRIASWNVNSVRARLDHVTRWLIQGDVDVLALQETKVRNSDFPHAPFDAAGYTCLVNGQKSYNGVAVVARTRPDTIADGIPGFDDPARRVLACALDDLLLVNLYVPNGQAVGSDKYAYKLDWLAALAAWLDELTRAWPRLLVLGDFNIAPADADVHDADAWRDRILCSEPERAALARLTGLGLADLFRRFEQPPGCFSWWDYRADGFARNRGLRIDLMLATAALAKDCRACTIDSAPRGWERPSDHAPVIADIADGADQA